MSKRDHGELARLFKRLRRSQGLKAATEALNEIRKFLSTKNKQAQESLEEAGEELLALFSLNVPSTLNVSLLSTNCIENAFLNTRRKIGRVTRWRKETDQPSRWLAYAFQEAEKGFRCIRGHKDLDKLRKALNENEDEKTTSKENRPIIKQKGVDEMVIQS